MSDGEAPGPSSGRGKERSRYDVTNALSALPGDGDDSVRDTATGEVEENTFWDNTEAEELKGRMAGAERPRDLGLPQQLEPRPVTPGPSNGSSQRSSLILVHKKDCTLSLPEGQLIRKGGPGLMCECGTETIVAADPLAKDIPHYKLTVPEFFSLSGMGKFQYIHALCFLFIFMRDGIEVIYAALIKPSLSCLWGLSTIEGFMIPAFPALTYAVGSQVFGVLADKYGRKICLGVALGLALGFDIGCALSESFIVFITLRCCAGFCLGGAFAITLTFWTEIVPKNSRFKSLFIFSLFWSTGTMLAVVDGWAMSDVRDHLNYHLFILIICVPTAIAFVLSFSLMETPSYYIVSGQIEEAVKRIKDVIEMNGMEAASYDVLCEGHFYNRGAIDKLFRLPYLKVTLTFMVLSFAVGYTFSGWTNLISNLFVSSFCTFYEMFVSSVSDDGDAYFCLALTMQAYILILIAVLGAFPGYIVAYVVSKKSGPMNYVIISFFLAAYFFFAMNFCILPHPYAFYLFYGELFITRALLGGGYLMLWLYTPVYYHTQVRAVGVGLGIFCQKLGVATAAAIISLTDTSIKIYSFAAMSLVVSAVAVMLSEPAIRQILFNQTGNVMKPPTLEDLYKHHHIPAADLSWHIRNVEREEKQKKKDLPPYVLHSKRHVPGAGSISDPAARGPDFNWVDYTPSPDPTVSSLLTSTNYFSSDPSSGAASTERDLPLEKFMDRKVYQDAVTPNKPTFFFDRSAFPRRSVIRPLSAEPSETTYILTPTNVRSEGNTPDPAAAERKKVFIRRRRGSASPVYENKNKKGKHRRVRRDDRE